MRLVLASLFFVPEECDEYCSVGCNEVEDTGCMADCGCATE